MQNSGYIKIDRRIREHWLWENPRRLKWWLDLLMMAAWEDRKTLLYNKICHIQRGQLIASNSFLRDRWEYKGDDELKHKPTQGTIINFLRLLEQDQMITCDRATLPNRTTLITILNYDKYQDVITNSDNTPNNTPNNTLNNTPNKQINKLQRNNNIIDDDVEDAREKNLAYLKKYFDEKQAANLEQILMQLHSENPDTKTIEDFKKLAWAVVCEWMQNEEPPKKNYTEFSRHLINQIRIKNRKQKQNGTPNDHRPDNEAEAKRKRDEEFARYVAEKLSRGDVPGDVQDWY